MLHVGRLGKTALFVYLKEGAEEEMSASEWSFGGGLVRSFL
jgi:hypothetical protein